MIGNTHMSAEYVWGSGQTSLGIPASLTFTDSGEAAVYVNGTQVPRESFTVEEDEATSALRIVFSAGNAPAAGDRVAVGRDCRAEQPVTLYDYQSYDREVIERMFDRAAEIAGELKEKTSRAVLAPAGTGRDEYDAWVKQVTEPAKSAYDLWREAGNDGSEADFLQSLKGEKGDNGGKGDKGDKGEPGAPASLSIGTVSQGAAAGATITGTAPNQVLNLVLPKGDKGDKGDTGSGSAYTLPVAGDNTLGGVKVSSAEPKILYVAADGTLFIDSKKVSDALVTTQMQTPVAQLDGTPFLTVNHDNTLRVKYSGGKFELGVSTATPAASVQVADGGTVALHPSDAAEAKRFTLAGAATLTLTADSTETPPATASVAYIDLALDVPAAGSVAAGGNVTLADALEAGKRNYCIMRCSAEAGGANLKGTLYVCDAEDLTA